MPREIKCFLSNRTRKDLKFHCIHYTYTGEVFTKESLIAMAKKIDVWHSKRSWAQKTKTKGEYGFYFANYHWLVAHGWAMLIQHPKYSRFAGSDCCQKEAGKSTNRNGIHVAIVSNFDTNEDLSELLLATLVATIGISEKKYSGNTTITTHGEQARLCNSGTACPGKVFRNWYSNGGREQLIAWINKFIKEDVLPFGYSYEFDGQFIRVFKKSTEDPCIVCRNDLRRCLQAKEQLSKKVAELEKQLVQKDKELKDAREKLREQGKTIADLHGQIRLLQTRLKECEEAYPWCIKLKDFIIAFLQWLIGKINVLYNATIPKLGKRVDSSTGGAGTLLG